MKTKGFMTIDELKRIAEENDYVLSRPNKDYKLNKRYSENYININGNHTNRIWIMNPSLCDERDFNMIRAAVDFAEIPLDERGGREEVLFEA